MLIHLLTAKDGFGVPYVSELREVLVKEGHDVEVFFDHEQLPSGDLMFLLGYLKIIGKEILDKHSRNLVIHASDLPCGKGWSPVAWQIVEGKNKIPFTLFEADDQLDAGDIYKQDFLDLKGTEVFEEWRGLQWRLICKMVVEFVEAYPDVQCVPQKGVESYYRKRNQSDDELSIQSTLGELFNKIRVCDPNNYPAWFEVRGRKFELRITPKD